MFNTAGYGQPETDNDVISTLEIKCNAAHPDMPLMPLVAFRNSPSSIRILDVPKRIGQWTIDEVVLQVQYPDGTIKSKACQRVGNVWIGTVEGTDTTGSTSNGYQITASGLDEDGNPVTGYVLGIGNVVILDSDGQVTPGKTTHAMRLYDGTDLPDEPQVGDAYLDMYEGSLCLYVWGPLGGWHPAGYTALDKCLKDGINDVSSTVGFRWRQNNFHVDIGPVNVSLYNKDAKDALQLGVNHLSIGSDYAWIKVGDAIYIGDILYPQTGTKTSVIRINGEDLPTQTWVGNQLCSQLSGYMPIGGKTTGNFRLGSNESCIMWDNKGGYLGLNGEGNSIWLDTGTFIELEDGWDQLKTVVSSGRVTEYQTLPEYLSSNYAQASAINDAKVTIMQGGVQKGFFTLNQSNNKTIVLDASITSAQVQAMIDASIGNVLQEAF